MMSTITIINKGSSTHTMVALRRCRLHELRHLTMDIGIL
jgi:hypothetical protein